MWCAKAVGVAFLNIILCSTFWKGSDACAVNISVTGAPRISISEQQSYVQITLTSDNATSAVTVTAYPHAVTVINGSDVKLSNTSITFPANQTSVSTNITILSDQSLENTETFYIQFVSTDPEVCIVNNNITVRITNDDKVTVGFNDTTIFVREDNADIPIKLTLTGQSAIPVTVGYMTTGIGNATSNVDYNRTIVVPSWSNFPAGLKSRSENVVGLLMNDRVTESTECFEVKLTTTMADVILSPEKTTVCITNDDKVEFDFLYSNMTVEENMRYISIPINKTGRSAIPVNFRLTMGDKSYSTAIRGVDYEDRHDKVITFPASDQQLSTMYVNVTIKMDGKAESSEVFSVGLEAVDSSTATIGSKNNMVVKITDKKDNDDFAAREMQREQDEKKRNDTLFLIMYITVAFTAVTIIILILICVLIIKKLKKVGK